MKNFLIIKCALSKNLIKIETTLEILIKMDTLRTIRQLDIGIYESRYRKIPLNNIHHNNIYYLQVCSILMILILLTVKTIDGRMEIKR